MIYMENATSITVKDCALKAAGIAAIWMQETNTNHTISGARRSAAFPQAHSCSSGAPRN